MSYSEEDILDLYEELQSVGLAETSEEGAARAASLLTGRIMTMDQASKILTDNRIPHTFYTTLWEDSGRNQRANWILVRGLAVFYDNSVATGPTGIYRSPEGLKEAMQDFNYITISEAHYTDVNLLPKSGQTQDPAASESIYL
jgi:hypothetical protein